MVFLSILALSNLISRSDLLRWISRISESAVFCDSFCVFKEQCQTSQQRFGLFSSRPFAATSLWLRCNDSTFQVQVVFAALAFVFQGTCCFICPLRGSWFFTLSRLSEWVHQMSSLRRFRVEIFKKFLFIPLTTGRFSDILDELVKVSDWSIKQLFFLLWLSSSSSFWHTSFGVSFQRPKWFS